jgi:hypothetical protein
MSGSLLLRCTALSCYITCDPSPWGKPMMRRSFITLLGGVAAWPLAARAQQTTKSRKVGVLHPGESTTVNMRVAAIREGLNGPANQHDLSFEIIVRLADGDVSRLPALATDLVNNRVDAIVAVAPAAVQAAAGATTSIPVIAIDLESDPVASGFVRSLARPGGNVTGVFLDFPDFSAKCLQLLIETVPTLSGVGVLWDPTTGALQLKAVEDCRAGIWHYCAGVRGAACSRHRRGVLCARPLALPGFIAAVVAANCRQSAIDRGPRDPKKSPDDLAVPRNSKSGRADRLWARNPGSFSSGRRDGAQGLARRQRDRVAGGAADAISTRGEFEDREADRYHAAGIDSAPRRRGD